MSSTNSLKKVFFLTNSEQNQPKKLPKISISLSKKKSKKRINKSYKNSKVYSIYDKRHYKLNKDIKIFPSPECVIKHKYNPISIKTGQINQKKTIQNQKFYLPIMKKSELKDPFQSMLLEDISYKFHNKKILNLKNNIMKLNTLKIEKSINKNNSEDENEKSTMLGYSFDRYGRPILKRSLFNADMHKDNVEKNQIENILSKINSKRRSLKEQILMRNKFQHTKNYNNQKIIPLSHNNMKNEYKYIDFKKEAINKNSRFNTENKKNKNYDLKEVYARDLIKEKITNLKVNGNDKLYMNLIVSIKPKKFINFK